MNNDKETGVNGDAIYWDSFNPDISANPYALYKRLRDEAPLYYNKQHDFYAVSRFADVERCLADHQTFSSARGDIFEIIKADIDVPPGMFIWEDPPEHTAYRSVVSRVFTPRRMNELEGKIRAYCASCLDPLVGAGRIDFIADLGAKLPGGVIGMLLGIPEQDRDLVRERVEASLRTEAGQPMSVDQTSFQGEGFEEYVDWRVKNPSSDLMTELLARIIHDGPRSVGVAVDFRSRADTLSMISRDFMRFHAVVAVIEARVHGIDVLADTRDNPRANAPAPSVPCVTECRGYVAI